MSLNANQIPVYAITPKTAVADLSAATAGALGATTNAVTVVTASASGSRVYSLIASTTDTAAVNLYLQIVDSGGTVVRPIGQINVPLRSGDTASTLMVDCLDPTVCKGLPMDNTGKRYIELGASETLRVSVVATMTAAKHCYVAAQYADYV